MFQKYAILEVFRLPRSPRCFYPAVPGRSEFNFTPNDNFQNREHWEHLKSPFVFNDLRSGKKEHLEHDFRTFGLDKQNFEKYSTIVEQVKTPNFQKIYFDLNPALPAVGYNWFTKLIQEALLIPLDKQNFKKYSTIVEQVKTSPLPPKRLPAVERNWFTPLSQEPILTWCFPLWNVTGANRRRGADVSPASRCGT